jgi:alkylation response protein AidB-like acyl-CoA dehydrogenase
MLMGGAEMGEDDVQAADLVSLVRRFGETEVAPRIREYDANETLPGEILERMANLGFFGGTVPEEYGGLGLDYPTYVSVIEEMSKFDHCLAMLMSMPSGLVGSGILKFGSEHQKDRWLRPLASGSIFGGGGVTEPRSGSDVAGTQTRYRRNGSGFRLTGAKAWITNLDIASFFVTFATCDPTLGRQGISAFIVPADGPGVIKRPITNKLGFRPLCTGELTFDDVELDAESLLGEEGDGFRVAMTAVERGRLTVAARAVGLAQACLDDAAAYAKERVVFGQPISEFQMVQKKLADMAVEIQAARLLTLDCARTLETGQRGRRQASTAKMFASDVAQRAATEALQIHGANGVSDEFRVNRFYRDSKVFQIIEGPNDVHRSLVSDYVLGVRSD